MCYAKSKASDVAAGEIYDSGFFGSTTCMGGGQANPTVFFRKTCDFCDDQPPTTDITSIDRESSVYLFYVTTLNHFRPGVGAVPSQTLCILYEMTPHGHLTILGYL